MKGIIGNTLISHSGPVSYDDTIGKASITGLYFSALSCSYCNYFTPILKQSYEQMVKTLKPVQIVFFSLDSNIESFNTYYSKMPWLTVPYNPRRASALLSNYGIQSIPSLLVFDKNGKLITKEGVKHVEKSKEKAFDIWMQSSST